METAIIIGVVIGGIIGLYKWDKERETKEKIEEERNSSAYVKVEYLGGHPLKSEGIDGKLGALSVEDNKVTYLHLLSNEEVFEIDITDITDCSVETKESLNAKRMALVGLLAFALKKGKKYVRIAFEHELGEQEVVFHHEKDKHHEIVEQINKHRMQNI